MNKEIDIFLGRRKKLLKKLKSNSAVVIATNPFQTRSRDTEFTFRPDSDFFYLTGFSEPNAVLLLVNTPQPQSILFCKERDAFKEMWDGNITGTKRAKRNFGFDTAIDINLIDQEMPNLISGIDTIYYSMTALNNLHDSLMRWSKAVSKTRYKSKAPKVFEDIDETVHEMRIIKDNHEKDIMRKSAQIAASAHINAMKACKPGMYEFELESEFLYEFKKHGSTVSYDSIVGAGNNACVLHYRENSSKIKSGDLILIDAGCEYKMYASDITRTFPANGKFTNAQKEIYEIVYEANRAAIKKVVPGNVWSDPHDAAVRVITRGLVELGLLKGNVNQLIKNNAHTEFFMHKTGHWLGIDVHDVGRYLDGEKPRQFRPGMITTIEPGIYISNNSRAPKKYRGIGIRLEDDVLVTKSKPEILTKDVPITINAIEHLMASNA
ncbi:MAG: Xaa-Pro aminopeptidase [Proteobacteria bacterium]|nr:Xaa-Pro aminopeptidase [Pseudomonadota bacterium]